MDPFRAAKAVGMSERHARSQLRVVARPPPNVPAEGLPNTLARPGLPACGGVPASSAPGITGRRPRVLRGRCPLAAAENQYGPTTVTHCSARAARSGALHSADHGLLDGVEVDAALCLVPGRRYWRACTGGDRLRACYYRALNLPPSASPNILRPALPPLHWRLGASATQIVCQPRARYI